MELDVIAAPSKTFIETLRGWLTELEHLEATGAATPDSCEMLVEEIAPSAVAKHNSFLSRANDVSKQNRVGCGTDN